MRSLQPGARRDEREADSSLMFSEPKMSKSVLRAFAACHEQHQLGAELRLHLLVLHLEAHEPVADDDGHAEAAHRGGDGDAQEPRRPVPLGRVTCALAPTKRKRVAAGSAPRICKKESDSASIAPRRAQSWCSPGGRPMQDTVGCTR